MEIVKTDNQNLSKGFKMIQGQKLRLELQTTQGTQRLTGQLIKLFSLQHTFNGARSVEKYDESEISIIVKELVSMIQEKYLSLTLEELVHICKKGMTGAYNDKVYFSVMSVRSWIEEYLKTERQRISKELIKKRNDEFGKPKELTEEEIKQNRIAMFKQFLYYLDTECQKYNESPSESKYDAKNIAICLAPSYWYDKFIEMGFLVKPSDEEKTKVFDSCIKPAELLLKQKNVSLSPTVGNFASDKVKDNAIVLAKWHFVRGVIFDWFEKGVDFKGLLNNEIG
jgi:hypothetical protein